MADAGFCSACGLARTNDEYGWPISPCVCFVQHHAETCALRQAIGATVAAMCTEHGEDACPACNPCSCDVDPDRAFVWAKHVFSWEYGIGLMPTTRI